MEKFIIDALFDVEIQQEKASETITKKNDVIYSMFAYNYQTWEFK